MARGATRTGGQALIEFALILPLLFLLILNLVNFSTYIYACITVANAARAGAQYMVMGGAWANSPKPPNAAQIEAVVRRDASSLPDIASLLSVQVCTAHSPATCFGWGDPEPAGYILGAVDVTYNYAPMIPFWDFPGLGIHLTLPPTSIHRRAVMRMVQ